MKVRTFAVTVSAFLTALVIVFLANITFSHIFPVVVPDPVPDLPLCRRSVDRVFVVDEKGRVCKWTDVNYKTGCCPDEQNNSDGCQQCKHNCCGVYAYCISCCLQPKNPIQHNFSNPEINIDKFDYCRGVCRTSSRSVINENQWISELKYCFPTQNFYLSSQPTRDEEDGENMELTELGKFNSDPNKVGGLRAKPKKSDDDGKIITENGEIKTEKLEGKMENEVDIMLTEMKKAEKKQEDLLEKLEKKMKKLMEENQHLMDVNKDLTEKLEQVQKGNLQDGQSLHEKREKSESQRMVTNSLVILFFLIVGMCVHGCIIN